MNNILITGGAGFIGSNFLDYYFKNEKKFFSKIVVLDKLTYAGDIKRINKYFKEVIFINGDICHEEIVNEIIKDFDITCIINFAAESHVDRSITDQATFINTNILGVQNLINQAKKNWYDNDLNKYKENTKFIQISTDEVYGSSNESDNLYFDENSPLNPGNPYAATKASAELMINAFINTYNFPAIIIRSSNNYGPNQNTEKLIPKVIEKILNNEDIPLYGNGLNLRNWLYVDDNCRGIMEIIKHGRLSNVYNIAGTNQLTNKELIIEIIEIMKSEFKINYKGKINFVEDRLGHDYCYRISGEKAKKELKFAPKIDLKEGIMLLLKEWIF